MISPTSFSDTLASAQPVTGKADHAAIANPATAYDAALVCRFKSGDEEAFVEIVARHQARIHSVALGHLRNHADAEEIVQDTFLRAYRGLALFRGDSSLSSWLHSIVFNLSRNRHAYFFRRQRHKTDSFDCPLSDDNNATAADFVASNTPDPVREEINREFLAHVATCMAKLGVRQREILILRNRRYQSYETIAAHLGISAGTVKSRIARARHSLREHLAHMYGSEVKPNTSTSFHWFERSRLSTRLQAVGACG